jgi:RNA polymerase sigma factor (sigma-70 family)
MNATQTALFHQWEPLAAGVAGKYNNMVSPAMGYDDMKQVCLIALARAVESFDPEQHNQASFYTHANTVMNNALKTALNSAFVRKDRFTQSLNKPIDHGDDNGGGEDDHLSHLPDESTPMANDAAERAEAKRIVAGFIKQLSPVDQKVMKLWASGMKKVEIADRIGCTRMRISQIIAHRVPEMRKKLAWFDAKEGHRVEGLESPEATLAEVEQFLGEAVSKANALLADSKPRRKRELSRR